MPIPQTDYGKACGDALLQFWRVQQGVTTLALVKLDWDPQEQAQPVYPDNPYTDCPRALLRMYQDSIAPGPGSGISITGGKFSLWVQLRQTPGESHQEILLAAMKAFIDPLVGNWRGPCAFLPSGAKAYGFYVDKPIIRNELHHDFDDPKLRVSIGEIPITVDAKSYS